VRCSRIENIRTLRYVMAEVCAFRVLLAERYRIPRKPGDRLPCEYLFHDCPPAVTQWALSTLRLMLRIRPSLRSLRLHGDRPEVPSSYISCDDRAFNPDWWEIAARERLRLDPIRIQAGHGPHVSRPAALASVLDPLARLDLP
jgi:hypothetical protein